MLKTLPTRCDAYQWSTVHSYYYNVCIRNYLVQASTNLYLICFSFEGKKGRVIKAIKIKYSGTGRDVSLENINFTLIHSAQFGFID